MDPFNRTRQFIQILFFSLILGFTFFMLSSCRVTYRHDNGKHKGWYKNPKNPHHPNSDNPGHKKKKKKKKKKMNSSTWVVQYTELK